METKEEMAAKRYELIDKLCVVCEGATAHEVACAGLMLALGAAVTSTDYQDNVGLLNIMKKTVEIELKAAKKKAKGMKGSFSA